MMLREWSSSSHHCQLLWKSVGKSASAGFFGSQRIPIELGFCVGNQTGLQKTGKNRPGSDSALLALANNSTRPPLASDDFTSSFQTLLTSSPLGGSTFTSGG